MKNIMTLSLIAFLFASCADNGNEAETSSATSVEIVQDENTITYSTVAEGSHLEWRASHLGGVEPRFGKIFLQDASVLVNDGKVTNANMNIDMASLSVENFPEGAEEIGKLKTHLQNEDFFNVAKYPTSSFELSSIEANEGEFNSKVTGNLNIMDSSKSVTFMANVEVSDNAVTIKSEDFSIDRRDWNLTHNVEGTEGVPTDYIIANDVGFTIDATIGK